MNLRLPLAVLAGLLFTLTAAVAEEQLVPPPPGAKLVFEAVGQGVQIYACEKAGDGYHWVFKAPDAALFELVRAAGRHPLRRPGMAACRWQQDHRRGRGAGARTGAGRHCVVVAAGKNARR